MAWFTFWDKTHTTKGGKRINVLWGMLLVFAVAVTAFVVVERGFHYGWW